MSSVCPSDDLLMVRITGLAAGTGLGAGAAATGFGVSTGKGFMALRILLDWLAAPGLLAAGKGAIGAGLVDMPERTGGVFFTVSVVAAATLEVVPAFMVAGIVAGLMVFAVTPVLFGVAGAAVVLATKYSCALKTFKQEPQRTAPLADCSWLGVTRKAVPHLGQRVIIWLLAEVMVYLLLTQGGPLKTRSIFYRYPTV